MKPILSPDSNVFSENRNLYTKSLAPGKRVYGERLTVFDGIEYREWSPRRSKLSAYFTVGGQECPFKSDSRVLYLGASSGTTPSHVADIVPDGKVFCVEFAPRMFRDLVQTCENRPNMFPILGDATEPSGYEFIVERADIVYADVAQKRQADIVADNMDAFDATFGMVAIKARSEDVTAEPSMIFKDAENRLKERGFTIIDSKNLDPHEKDHRMIVFRR